MDANQLKHRIAQFNYIGLNIDIGLYADAPVLDSILIDWQNKGCNEQLIETIYNCLSSIRRRLFNAGFIKYSQGVISKPEILKYLENYPHFKMLKIRTIKSIFAGNDLYILTKQADGRLFIHPPYDNNKLLSWDDYFSRIAIGEKLPLMIDAPWAQVKVINIL